jgi:hypothetical protein
MKCFPTFSLPCGSRLSRLRRQRHFSSLEPPVPADATTIDNDSGEASNIDLMKRAQGIVDTIEDELHRLFPKHLGQTIAGIQAYVDRVDPIIQSVSLDPVAVTVSIVGRIRYKTYQ